MAGGNDNAKLQIDLELRKEQFEEKLRAATQRAKEQLESIARIEAKLAKDPNSKFVQGQLNTANTAYQNRLGDVATAQKNLDDFNLRIDQDEAKKGGRVFGIEVSKQTEKFVKGFLGAYVGREVMNLGIQMAKTPGGDNNAVEQGESMLNGMVSGGSAGAMIGGPWGAAIGALAGSLINLASTCDQQSKEIRAAATALHNSDIKRSNNFNRSMMTEAFNKRLGMMGSRRERMDALAERYGNTNRAAEEFSKKMAAWRADGKSTNTNRYKDWEENYNARREEANGYLQQMYREAMTQNFRSADISTYTDKYAKMGMYSGNSADGINIDKVNQPVVDNLKQIKNLLERMSGDGFKLQKLDNGVNRLWMRYGSGVAQFAAQ